MKKIHSNRGISLAEIMLTILILGTLMSLAVVSYQKTILHAHEREMGIKLQGIYSAAIQYEATNDSFYSTGGAVEGLSTFATPLELSMSEVSFNNSAGYPITFHYISNGTTFDVSARYGQGTTGRFVLRIDPLTYRPCCSNLDIDNSTGISYNCPTANNC